MDISNLIYVLDNCLSICTNKDIDIYLLNDESVKKKIKHGKLISHLIKDNIIRFEFENVAGKHDNNFFISLPYDIDYSVEEQEIVLSFKNKKLLEVIDADDLLDLEEQNTSKSLLYNKALIIKWN